MSKAPITPLALRAPELIAQAPFDHSIDIWSFGCLVYELLTGTPLFPVACIGGAQDDMDSCDDDHILQMNGVLGPLPEYITSRWSRQSKYFDDEGMLVNSMIDGPPDIIRWHSLEELFKENKSDEISEEEEGVVLDLLRSIFKYETKERPEAEDLLGHTWFQRGF